MKETEDMKVPDVVRRALQNPYSKPPYTGNGKFVDEQKPRPGSRHNAEANASTIGGRWNRRRSKSGFRTRRAGMGMMSFLRDAMR